MLPLKNHTNRANLGDPMLSDLTAEDWERDVHLFEPVPFSRVFAPVSMNSHPFLGTLSSPI